MQRGSVSNWPGNVVLCALLCGVFAILMARSDHHLRARIKNGLYEDEKISVQIPAAWNPTINGEVRNGSANAIGLVLRKDRYILRLCTGCAQTSGIVGGRFSEIAGLVQPWYRADPEAKPFPCGKREINKISTLLDRIDFWYRRDLRHPSEVDADDCHEPNTTATVWYGSYFAERCPPAVAQGYDCGGFFLHSHWLAKSRADDPFNEMVIALTYDASGPDSLPRREDRELRQILREATAIVRSVHFRASQESP
jgi:hypothetical protein